MSQPQPTTQTATKKTIISYPHFGEYRVAIKVLLSRLFAGAEIMHPPPMTKRTLELGTLNSPEFVCVPYKYTLGNYIEALEQGATVLLQAAGGCRFGYYGEIQDQTLKDLGFDCKFVSLLSDSGFKPKRLYLKMVEAGCQLTFLQFIKHFLFALKVVVIIDKLGLFYRENVAFEVEKGAFNKAREDMYNELLAAKSQFALGKIQKKYDKIYRAIKINKPEKPIKVLVVGEIYCVLEPSSNYFLEDKLAQNNIEIHRYLDMESSIKRHSNKHQQKMADESQGYIKYVLEAHGTYSATKSVKAALNGFDGIIHIKPFGCIPEISAMPAMIQVSSDHKIPILYFSFDSHTSETGIQTRLEAFVDMLQMKKERTK